jgi:DNA-binding beta-propeller fold protein YncE
VLFTSEHTGCMDPDSSGPLSLGDGQLNSPERIPVDSTGNVYVADTGNSRIQVFSLSPSASK